MIFGNTFTVSLEMDIILAAADTDVIKTYVRLGIGVGLIADMAYDPMIDSDLVIRKLNDFIPSSSTKVAYLKHNYLPLYSQHFIEELLIAAKEFV
jgi:LysR family transcriptional regulator, cys regulon transcriptional activator